MPVRRRLLVAAAAIVTLTTALVAFDVSPALAATTYTARDSTSAAKATLTVSADAQKDVLHYTFSVCDTKADGHHAEGVFQVAVNFSNTTQTIRLKATGVSTSGGLSGCEFPFNIWAENWEGSTELTWGPIVRDTWTIC